MPPPSTVQIDSWRRAEEHAAAWMRWWGFDDAQVTRSGADGGVDVRARNAIAQVKFEAAQVGRPTMQQLAGARGVSHDRSLFFFSGAGFSKPAIEYADKVDIALFHYTLTGAMTAANRTARLLLRAVADREEVAAEARAAEAREAARRRQEADRAAREREDVARRARDAKMAADRLAASEARRADEARAARARAAQARAAEEARRAARARATVGSTTYDHGSRSGHEKERVGPARDARVITEQRPHTAAIPGTKKAASTPAPQERHLQRRRTRPRLWAALICSALVALAVADEVRGKGGIEAAVLFSVLALIFFSGYRSAIAHNRMVQQLRPGV